MASFFTIGCFRGFFKKKTIQPSRSVSESRHEIAKQVYFEWKNSTNICSYEYYLERMIEIDGRQQIQQSDR